MNDKIFRSEYPKPQFQRDNWINLNGQWDFAIDNEKILDVIDFKSEHYINVPFCPQSKLSGIEHRDFIKCCHYRRHFSVPASFIESRVFLHFGAVDYNCKVYINGVFVGEHFGGYTSFKFEITEYIKEENTIAILVEDDETNELYPCGKQSARQESYACFYTRTTGIWQTVWLEATPKNYIKSAKYTTNAENGLLFAGVDVVGDGNLCLKAFYEGKLMGEAFAHACDEKVEFSLELAEKHLWEIGKGRLYDLELTFGDDRVKSYFGLRDISYTDNKFTINGKSVFQRLVLDQGFYPDGIYTAPSDSELIADIERSIACGFNGARLHEKVFEERFLYHCDKRGYIVWGEFADWGADTRNPNYVEPFIKQWLESMERDYNHPAIIGWCPHNETYHHIPEVWDNLQKVYEATKAYDSTRPAIDASGWYHKKTDLYDVHDYTQAPSEFAEAIKRYVEGGETPCNEIPYDGTVPFFVSEYGGIQWTSDDGAWGYGNAPKTEADFIERFKGQADVMLDDKRIMGFCYTQLTDVEQEKNGLYTYDRIPKFDPEILKEILSRKAAIED